MKHGKKKTLIEPKVRILLWIYLYGVKNENNWLAKLAKVIDYSSTGSLDALLTDLLDKNLIESYASDSKGPPYRVTEEGKRFLQPILVTRKIGIFTSFWVTLWAIVYFVMFQNHPLLIIICWLPLLLVSFVIIALVLTLYPYIIVRFGKISY